MFTKGFSVCFLVVVVVLSALFEESVAIQCLSCSHVHRVFQCNKTIDCQTSENCYLDARRSGGDVYFSLGCRKVEECYNGQTSLSSVIGRRELTYIADDDSTTAVTSDCEECCSTERCNRQLCKKVQDAQCSDHPDYNCELIGHTFNICNDVQHARGVCRKYCNLCDMVDGDWTTWNTWSLCDATCGHSQRIRLRYCTNPTPAHGGLDCRGSLQEFQNCTVGRCPIHGGWNSWSTWSACGATCGVGLKNRQRTCTNPTPEYSGNHCFGDSVDDQVCYLKACAGVGWSTWSTWGACSASCNGGIKTRSRTCNNPAPSAFGQNCVGNSMDYTACSTMACTSVSDERIFFTVNTPTGQLLPGDIPEFSHVIINEGNGYNQAKGDFVCRVPGIYQFFVTFLTTTGRTQCMIRKNLDTLVYALTTATDWKSASASTYVHLSPGDVIDLHCGNWDNVDHNASTMFSGALVSAN